MVAAGPGRCASPVVVRTVSVLRLVWPAPGEDLGLGVCRQRVWGWVLRGVVVALWACWRRWVWVRQVMPRAVPEEPWQRQLVWPALVQGGPQAHWVRPDGRPVASELKGRPAWRVGLPPQVLLVPAGLWLVRVWSGQMPRVWPVPSVRPLQGRQPS